MGKMDVEGAEPLVLRGAQKMLSNANPPVWQLEVEGYSTMYGVKTDEILTMLAKAGYDSVVYDPNKNELVSTATPWTEGVHNILAVARNKRDFVIDRLKNYPLSL